MLNAFRPNCRFVWACLVVGATSAGCAAVDLDPLNVLGAKKKLPLDPASSVIVEIRPDSGEPKQVLLPHDDTLVIQTALEKSGATRRFKRMDVTLVRLRPDGNGLHKIEIKYEAGKRRVLPSCDYALRPGDRVVAVEDATTALDDMVDQVTGPLKIFSRGK